MTASFNPALKVEIAFASAPLDTAPTWTDVSAYVREMPGVSIKRGKSPELDYFPAGTCQLTLNNRDRRFDPSYASGPYFGNLLPRKQVRVTATWSAVDYTMFYGFVAGWPQSFSPGGKDATVTIECIDGLAWLAANRVPTDLVYSYANTTIGSLGFFLRGASTTAWNDATNNGYGMTLWTGTGATSSTLTVGSSSASMTFNGTTSWRNGPRFTSGASWSISFWIRTTDTTAPLIFGGGTGSSGFAGSGPFTGAFLNANGTFGFSWGNGASGSALATTRSIADGIPHHIVLAGDGTDSSIYLDGLPHGTGSSPAQPVVIDIIGTSTLDGSTYITGSIEDFAVFNKRLSAAEVLAFYQRSYGYLEEDTGTRIGRILDDVSWPASWRSITSTPEATCGQLVYNALPALSLLQEVERTEQGRVFVARDGKLTFLSRYYNMEVSAGLTSQQDFSDDGAATALGYSTFGFRYDDVDVTNDVTVTTPITWAKSSDSTSITNYGLQSRKVDTILTAFQFADAMSRGLVAAGKVGTWRAPPIAVYVATNTSRWDEVLQLEIGQRITVEQTPMAVGSQNSQPVAIESIEWLLENEVWMLIIGGSPIFDNSTTSGWFIVDNSNSLVSGNRVVGY